MTKQEFFDKLLDIFEVEAINEDDVLRDFEVWDSLTALSIIALANSAYGVIMKATDLKGLTTVGDLLKFVEENKTK